MEGIFSLGSNGSGQLGLAHREDVSVPKQVLFESLPENDPIVSVAAGGNHTILLTQSGKAFWSGDGSNGACGLMNPGDAKDSVLFRPLSLPAQTSEDVPQIVTHVACTWDTTILALQDGITQKATRLRVLGEAGGGLGDCKIPADFPPSGTEIVDVAAGFRHVVVVLDNGEVYGWGHNRKSQLGPADGQVVVASPTKVAGVKFKVNRAVCCQYSTCLIAEPGDGTILVLGADKWNLKSAAPLAVPEWKTVTAGWGGIYILKYGGEVLAWGRDDHGQLPPPGLPPLTHLAAGSEHCLAVTEDGQLLAWGWGEHGNCGPQTDTKSGDVRGRWNVIASLANLPESSEITTIGAGCATSWVNIATGGIFL